MYPFKGIINSFSMFTFFDDQHPQVNQKTEKEKSQFLNIIHLFCITNYKKCVYIFVGYSLMGYHLYTK